MYLRSLLGRGVKNILKSTLKRGFPESHRGRGMTCESGIDVYLLSLVKGVNLNSKKRRVGTKPKSGGALRFVR
jgi:hypothetical protein